MRSNKSEVARDRRRFAFAASSGDSIRSSASSANEVGSTQLLVPGVQLQPRRLVLIGATSRCDESLDKNHRHGLESLGQSLQTQLNPDSIVPACV
jgi:hypothetical protein